MGGGNREKAKGTRNRKYKVEMPHVIPLSWVVCGIPGQGGLEVLIMVGEMSPILPINKLTGLFHILGHARRATAKHPDLPDLLGEIEVRASSVFRGRPSSESMLQTIKSP